ncbi:MAG TPA: site-2 protease family protein [Dermatophilaceae bacterium]|nr:site-2 protease family protein [Dermatophilaceae bacterium]
MYLLGVLFMAVAVAVSIALHEVGHLVPAKRFGVKVTQYMVGFGPTVWSRRRGETEYGVKAIPLGGYIRMIGMFPPRPQDEPGMLRDSTTGRFSQLMDQAREDSLREVRPGEEARVFYRLPVRQKLVIMLGGPVMNLVIAVVLLGGLFTLHGIAQLVPTVSTVSQCVRPTTATSSAPPSCAATDPVAPANAAGIRPGDLITSIGGRPVTSWDDVKRVVRASGGRQIDVVVQRAGATLSLRATPMLTRIPRVDRDGNLVTGPDGAVATEQGGFMGFTPTTAVVRQPVTAVPGLVWAQLAGTAGVMLRIPEKMVGVAQAAFGGGERDINGPVSIIGVGRVAGEVASGGIPGIGDGFGPTMAVLLSLVASLNLFLFVFNLVPLLPLDGGHVAGALWEGLKRQLARLRGLPNPGYVDVAKALPVAYSVSVVLLAMSALLIYADVVNPVKLTG